MSNVVICLSFNKTEIISNFIKLFHDGELQYASKKEGGKNLSSLLIPYNIKFKQI